MLLTAYGGVSGGLVDHDARVGQRVTHAGTASSQQQ